ncbi:MAG: helix-turn-helix transcriptional regulator [Cyclobacteriaceae bacterium]
MKNRLKVLRAEKEITQQQLAEMINVSRQTINSIEKNKYVPSTVLALKLSKIFGVSVNEIFQLSEEETYN